MAEGPAPDPVELARKAPNKMRDKYDYLLGDDLLATGYASIGLDKKRAREVADRISDEP
jgi:hypothetical protein